MDPGLRSYTEPWLDTTTPFGEALYYITVTYAQLERGVLRERVRADMERARREGRRIGRPRAVDRPQVRQAWAELEPAVRAGAIPVSEAARRLGVGRAAVHRLLRRTGDARPAGA